MTPGVSVRSQSISISSSASLLAPTISTSDCDSRVLASLSKTTTFKQFIPEIPSSLDIFCICGLVRADMMLFPTRGKNEAEVMTPIQVSATNST